MFSQGIKKSAICLQTSPTDIAGTVGNVRKCRRASTLWTPNVRKSQRCFHIFHLTHCDSQASFFATAFSSKINLHNKCVQESFSSMCARFLVKSLAFETTKTGSTCRSGTVQRDIILCTTLLGQKGVDSTCWLNWWVLGMTVHSAAWLLPKVKIQGLSPSYSGAMKATTWQTDWAVMAVNYVQSHWSHWVVSPNLRTICRHLERTLLWQLAMCISAAKPRFCELGMYRSLNSASTWLSAKQNFSQLLSGMRSIYNKCVQASFSPICARYFIRSLAFLASIHLQHPAEATQRNVWQKGVDQTCWLESWPPLWLSSHSRHALALWHVLRIKLLASLHLCSIVRNLETMWNTRTVQPNDWLEWASVLPPTYGLSLLRVLNCSLRQESQEQCARLTDLGTAIRKAQSMTYHIAAWVIPIMGKINNELSRSYMRMIEKSRTSWQRKCVSHWQSGLAFWLLRLISSCYQKHLQGLELA